MSRMHNPGGDGPEENLTVGENEKITCPICGDDYANLPMHMRRGHFND
jgi:uncharacterized Zn-finger protein